MRKSYDFRTNLVTVTATPDELYRDHYHRDLLPDDVRADLDEKTKIACMTPAERAAYYSNPNRNGGYLDDDTKSKLE